MTHRPLWQSWCAVSWALVMSCFYFVQMSRAIWHEHGQQLRHAGTAIRQRLTR